MYVFVQMRTLRRAYQLPLTKSPGTTHNELKAPIEIRDVHDLSKSQEMWFEDSVNDALLDLA